jgi:ribose 5-phosphate isomerase B
MIYIASDHGGFKLKEEIKKALKKDHISVRDLGPKRYIATDDYPDYAKLVAAKVSKRPNQDLGIIICRSGQGACIVANKFKHVRAAIVNHIVEAKLSREHNLANVLCLSADFTSPHAAKNVVEVWLNTPWGTDPRHLRRVKKIEQIEKAIKS